MTKEEFLAWAKSAGATMTLPTSDVDIAKTQNALQQMQAAMIPLGLTDFYKNTAGAVLLGDATIFGPMEIKREGANIYHIPSILQVNHDAATLPVGRGRTIFGRNSMFWFAFDAFGNCFMLNNVTLAPMRQYENIFKAMSDCLAVGKI